MVILDEADSMTIDAQLALKNTIDIYSRTTRFCLICNSIKKIHYSLVSRCIKFQLHPLSKPQIFEHLQNLCHHEKVNISDDAIKKLVDCSHGDMRKAINSLQSIHMAYEKIDLQCVIKYLNLLSENDISIILKSLSNDTIAMSYQLINNYIRYKGYSFYELLLEINNKIIFRDSMTSDKYQVIKRLGKIEYQTFSNVNIDILILTLISSFHMT